MNEQNEIKTERVMVRLTPTEKRVLSELSRLEDRNTSDLVRLLIREGGRRRGVVPVHRERTAES